MSINQSTIDLEKIHKVIAWAAEGLNEISESQVVMSGFYSMSDLLVDELFRISGRYTTKTRNKTQKYFVFAKLLELAITYCLNRGRKTVWQYRLINLFELLQPRPKSRSPPKMKLSL